MAYLINGTQVVSNSNPPDLTNITEIPNFTFMREAFGYNNWVTGNSFTINASSSTQYYNLRAGTYAGSSGTPTWPDTNNFRELVLNFECTAIASGGNHSFTANPTWTFGLSSSSTPSGFTGGENTLIDSAINVRAGFKAWIIFTNTYPYNTSNTPFFIAQSYTNDQGIFSSYDGRLIASYGGTYDAGAIQGTCNWDPNLQSANSTNTIDIKWPTMTASTNTWSVGMWWR